jgi:hypothetical protein
VEETVLGTRPARSRRALVWICAVAVALQAALIGCAWLALPTVQRQRHWFWPLRAKPLEALIVLFLLLLTAAVTAFVARAARSRPRQLVGVALIGLLGLALQHGLALAEGRGIDGMRDRIVFSGHSEFAYLASVRPRLGATLRGYEALAAHPRLPYARSKPPGQLAFYILAADVAERLPWLDALGQRGVIVNERHRRLDNFAALVFPLLSLAVLLPLFGLARRLGPADRALWPLLLYVLVPQTVLITLHLDQVLYPFLAALACWCVACAARSRHGLLWWAAYGACAWLGLFVSFSLLPCLLLAPFVYWSALPTRDRAQLRRLGIGLGLALVSFAALQLAAWLLLEYDLFAAYARCMENHRQWKHFGAGDRTLAFRLDLSELAYWTGLLPLTLLVAQAAAEAKQAWRRPRRIEQTLAVGVLAMIVATALVGDTLAEVARLWLFMVPPLVLVATPPLRTLDPRRAWPLYALVAVQFAWVITVKARQDFF